MKWAVMASATGTAGPPISPKIGHSTAPLSRACSATDWWATTPLPPPSPQKFPLTYAKSHSPVSLALPVPLPYPKPLAHRTTAAPAPPPPRTTAYEPSALPPVDGSGHSRRRAGSTPPPTFNGLRIPPCNLTRLTTTASSSSSPHAMAVAVDLSDQVQVVVLFDAEEGLTRAAGWGTHTATTRLHFAASPISRELWSRGLTQPLLVLKVSSVVPSPSCPQAGTASPASVQGRTLACAGWAHVLGLFCMVVPICCYGYDVSFYGQASDRAALV